MRTRSKKPGKQRKAQYNAPMHVRRKFLTAKLAPELREKYGIRRMVVRTNDVVRIMRGDMAGHEGKVLKVDYQSLTLHVDGVTMKKADGTPVFRPVQPSNVMIIKLDLSDKERQKIVERRKGRVILEELEEEEEKEEVTEEAEEKEKAAEEAPSEEVEEATEEVKETPAKEEGVEGQEPSAEESVKEEVEVNKEESKSEGGVE